MQYVWKKCAPLSYNQAVGLSVARTHSPPQPDKSSIPVHLLFVYLTESVLLFSHEQLIASLIYSFFLIPGGGLFLLCNRDAPIYNCPKLKVSLEDNDFSFRIAWRSST